MSQLRIALTLPGEASLGAFQAGALSALVVAMQKTDAKSDRVRVDVIAGTSSGSLTAVLASHCLLNCQDPVETLRRAWVVEPTIDALRGRDGRAPLTLDRAREVATELLCADLPAGRGSRAMTHPIKVNFALTSLRGFTYDFEVPPRRPGDAEKRSMHATSFLDWAEHDLDAGTDWDAVVESAIASASHPAAFAPSLLDRSDAGTLKRYKRNGVKNLPECRVFWYADGGLLDREPLGRCIRLARRADRDRRRHERLVLVLRPEPHVGFERADPAWTEDGGTPTWTTTLARAFRILVTHSLYEDMRRVERVNNRIVWREKVVQKLSEILCDDAETQCQLRQLLEDIRKEKGRMRAGEPQPGEPVAQTVPALLSQLLDEATGLAGKHQIPVEIVSAPTAADVAGGSLLNFGGFLSERLRASDFLVGYVAMVDWMETRAPENFGTAALEAANARGQTIPGWIGAVRGRRRLPWRARAEVVRIAGRAARIGLRHGARSPGI